MRMTTKGRYALRAAIALAKATDGVAPVSIKTLSQAEDISAEFLEQIFFKLRKAGLIESVRGPGGGFLFAKPLADITLKDIIEASGEGVELAACATGKPDACGRSCLCIAGDIWREMAEHLDSFLAGMTMQDIVDRTKSAVM
ncbi:MAG TPA: Rrf2 family transcriptional regulator [bacterium]|nr:Rrf2 family transcriptional regulator [bacterium]